MITSKNTKSIRNIRRSNGIKSSTFIPIVFCVCREEPKDKHHHVPAYHHQKDSLNHQESPPKFLDDNHEHVDENPFHKFGKMGCLVAVWLLTVGFLTSTPEKTLEPRQLAVPIYEPRIFNFPEIPKGTRINASFAGAFEAPFDGVVEQNLIKTDYMHRKSKFDQKEIENYIRVYLQTDTEKILTPPRIFAVVNPQRFDSANTTKVPIMFDIGEDNMEQLKEDGETIQMVIRSNFTRTPEKLKQEMPLTFIYDIAPINKQIGVIFAAFVLIFLYALIIWEVRFKI